jgi:Spy/CpxP family protein refolding chaperone
MAGMGMAHAMPGVPFNLIVLAEQLELTPEQRDKAGKILDETTPKVRALMFRMMDARKAGNALKSGTAGDKDIRRHADEQGEIVAELTYLGLKARADLRALLTEEQRKKLDSFTEGRGPFFIQRFGHMGAFDPARLPVTAGAGVRELKL